MCGNMQGLHLKRRRLDGSICCSKTWIYLSALMVPFQMCKPLIPYELMPPHHQRCRLLNWALIRSQKVPLLFSSEEATPIIAKKNVKFWFFLPQNRFPLRTRSFWMSFGRKKMVVFLDNVQIWLFLCIIELYLVFLDGTANCVQTVMFGSIPEPMQQCPSQNHACF